MGTCCVVSLCRERWQRASSQITLGFLVFKRCLCTQVLVQPLKSLGGTRRVWRKILSSWLLALIFAVPQLLIFVQTQERLPSPPGRTQDVVVYGCKSAGYTAEWQRKVYFTFMTSSHLYWMTS